MALKTKTELESLNVVFLGQPYVKVATTAIASTDLDTVFLGQPFVATEPAGGGVTQNAEADLASAFTQSATADKIVTGDSDLTVSATQSATVTVIENGSATLAVTTTLSADADAFKPATASLTATATVTAVGVLAKNGAASLTATASFTDGFVKIVGVSSTQASEFTQSVDGDRLVDIEADLVYEITGTFTANKSTDIDLVASSDNNLTIDADAIRSLDSALASEFAQSAQGNVIHSHGSTISVTTTFSASAIKNTVGSGAFTSSSTVAALGGKIILMHRAPKTLTAVGNARLSTSVSQFGVSSLLLNGTDDRVDLDSPDFAFGTGNFAVELWIRPADITNVVLLDSRSTGTSDNNGWVLYLDGSSRLVLQRGTTIITQTATSIVSLNVWTAVALTRNSGTFRIYTNGTQRSSATPATANFTNTNLRLGEGVAGTSFGDYNGYIDELRITKGNARYASSTYTVSTTQLRNDSNTVLLAHFDGANSSTTFVDDCSEYFDSAATVSATALRIERSAAYRLTTSTLSATVDNLTKEAEADLVYEITGTFEGLRVRDGGAVSGPSTASELVIVNKIGGIIADLTSTATVSAELTGVIQAEADLVYEITGTFEGNYTANAASAETANAALTSNSGFLLDGSATLIAQASKLTAAVKVGAVVVDMPVTSTVTASLRADYDETLSFTATSSLSCDALNIIFGGTTIYNIGVTPNSSNLSPTAPFLKLTTSTNPNTSLDDFVISFWAYSAFGTVVDFQPNSNTIDGSLSIGRFGISLTGNNSEQIVWNDEPPGYIDDDYLNPGDLFYRDNYFGYHHFLIRVNTLESTNALKYRLFRDGIEHTLISAPTNNFSISIGNLYNLMIASSFDGTYYTNVSGYGEIGDWYPGSPTFGPSGLTQFYFDYKTTSKLASDFPIGDTDFRRKFYPYIDMGADGTDSGLPNPKIYFRLRNKDELTNTGSLGGSASWKKFTLALTIPNRYTISDFTATDLNNSIGDIFNITSKFKISAEAVAGQIARADLSSNSTVSSQLTVNKLLSSALSSTSTVSSNAGYLREASATIQAIGFVVSAAARTGQAICDANVVSTVAVTAKKTTDYLADLTADTLLSGTVNNIRDLNSNLSSTSNLTADLTGVTLFESDFAVTSSVTADVGLVKGTSSAMFTDSTFVVSGTLGIFGQASLFADTAFTAIPEKRKTGSATLNALFNLQTNAGFQASAFANIQANGFVLAVGDIVQLDPYLTYIVEQETRTLVISGESRIYVADAESRIYIVTEETREYMVEENTAVNII